MLTYIEELKPDVLGISAVVSTAAATPKSFPLILRRCSRTRWLWLAETWQRAPMFFSIAPVRISALWVRKRLPSLRSLIVRSGPLIRDIKDIPALMYLRPRRAGEYRIRGRVARRGNMGLRFIGPESSRISTRLCSRRSMITASVSPGMTTIRGATNLIVAINVWV